jgi:hypothetical protein
MEAVMRTAISAMLLLAIATTPVMSNAREPGKYKYLNIALLTGPVLQHISSDSRIKGPGNRWVTGLSFQTGVQPIMADITLTSDRTIDFGIGAFIPIYRFRTYELVGSPFLFYRSGEKKLESLYAPYNILREVETTWGLAVRAEVLMMRKTLGFFVEARQTIAEPFETSVFMGVNWSPLMLLLLRQM